MFWREHAKDTGAVSVAIGVTALAGEVVYALADPGVNEKVLELSLAASYTAIIAGGAMLAYDYVRKWRSPIAEVQFQVPKRPTEICLNYCPNIGRELDIIKSYPRSREQLDTLLCNAHKWGQTNAIIKLDTVKQMTVACPNGPVLDPEAEAHICTTQSKN